MSVLFDNENSVGSLSYKYVTLGREHTFIKIIVFFRAIVAGGNRFFHGIAGHAFQGYTHKKI